MQSVFVVLMAFLTCCHAVFLLKCRFLLKRLKGHGGAFHPKNRKSAAELEK